MQALNENVPAATFVQDLSNSDFDALNVHGAVLNVDFAFRCPLVRSLRTLDTAVFGGGVSVGPVD